MELPAIPGYEPVRALGIACGVVCATIYLARRLSSGELVAVRVHDRRGAEDLLHRYSLLARLDHPNIRRVFEIGDFQGRSYCALEYVEEDLAERLRQGPLSRSQAIKLVPAIALALQYAWHEGMVPVNFIPNRVLLAADSVPKLFDFEPIQFVDKPLVVGSSEFMAPEEVFRCRATTSVSTLVYRVGAVMYAVLTGQPPFARRERTVETLVKVLKESPVRPRRVNATVDRDLEAICMKCLEKRPEDRYASLQDLAEHVAALEPPTGSLWSRLTRRFSGLPRPRRRRR
jgi:serine/threonine protein kinase